MNILDQHALNKVEASAGVARPQVLDLVRYSPVVMAVGASVALAYLRTEVGGDRFISDGALMMLALASYLVAAVFYLTNLWAPFRMAERLGIVTAALGVFFNLSSWLVRWVAAYDREFAIFKSEGIGAADIPWVFRYVPFANLYDLSLAFAFGAGITTLFVIRKPHFRVVAAISLPMAAIILVLARFIGGEFIDLPPVLDSYWRPIHVGIASLSYGIALVCFAVAVLYLLKDGLRVEKMRIWTGIFAISILATISKFSIFAPETIGRYTASVFNGASRSSLALRADIPYVGWLLFLGGHLLALSVIAYALYFLKRQPIFRRVGSFTIYAALVVQALGIATLFYQIKTLGNVLSMVDRSQYPRFGAWMMERQGLPHEQIRSMGEQQLYDIANKWITENAAQLHLSLNSNPVELAALVTAFAATFFVIVFGIKTEKLRAALPPASVLDALMYKLGGLAFAGLALLLMTGAVWANESWGRYWGWDSKEVGALVAWLTYAGFLHSRIAYGWRGSRSAYFAIAAFLFVIFTYLGVSYLLPGLHSYA